MFIAVYYCFFSIESTLLEKQN